MKKADPFYSSNQWMKTKQTRMMMDHYQCQDCLRNFKQGLTNVVMPAQMVHHIVPRQKDHSKELDLDNLVSLCHHHHELRHKRRAVTGGQKNLPNGMRLITIGGREKS